jgi:hypothetical protein
LEKAGLFFIVASGQSRLRGKNPELMFLMHGGGLMSGIQKFKAANSNCEFDRS